MNELFAYGYLRNWAPSYTDTIEYYFSAYQILMSENGWGYDYNPLTNVSTKIEIYGIKDYPIFFSRIEDKTYIKEYTQYTNGYGTGLLEFDLPLLEIKKYHMAVNECTGRNHSFINI